MGLAEERVRVMMVMVRAHQHYGSAGFRLQTQQVPSNSDHERGRELIMNSWAAMYRAQTTKKNPHVIHRREETCAGDVARRGRG